MASEKDKTSSENAKADEKNGAKPSGQGGKPESRTEASGSGRTGTGQGGAGQSSSGQSSSGQSSSGQGGSGQASSGRSGAGSAGSKQSGANQSGSKQTGSNQSGSGQGARAGAGSAKAGATRGGKPLTIDLTAEEVRSKQAQAEAESRAGARAGAGSGKQDAAAGERAKAAEGGAARRSSGGASGGSAKSGPGYGGIVLAAGIGAVVAFGAVWGAGQAGLLRFSGGQEIEDLRAELASADGRFAALDERMREIAKTEATPTVAPSVVNDLATRLEDLEARTEAGSGLEAEVQSVSDGLDDLRRFVSSGGAGSSAALASLGDSVEKIEGRVGELDSAVSQLQGDTSPAVQEALDDLNGKFASLDGRVTAASEAASAAAKAASEGDAVAGNTLQAFSGRLDSLGDTLKATNASLQAQTARLGTLEGAADSARKEIAAIREEISGLDERIAAMEDIMGGPGARETASRAIAVSLLKSAVDAGRSYESELAAVRSALPPDTDFQALEANADSGITTVTQLIQSFPDVAARMAATLERVDTGNSVADKFLNNMRSLVQVRATGDGAGTGPMGALGRMEANVRAGNLDQALEIYETLPDGTQNAGKEWAASARARLAADALVDKVTAEVIKALAKDS